MKLNEPVSVTLMYNHHQHKTIPIELMWRGRHYPVTKIGLRHTFRSGRDLVHTFSVVCQSQSFKLNFHTADLTWKLKEIAGE
jgi:hypothetical protein